MKNGNVGHKCSSGNEPDMGRAVEELERQNPNRHQHGQEMQGKGPEKRHIPLGGLRPTADTL